MPYVSDTELLSWIEVGKLHEITLRSGEVRRVYIENVTHHLHTFSFFGWNYSTKHRYGAVKKGIHYWPNHNEWYGVIKIKPIEV